MSDRFNIRSKCINWTNPRSQHGVKESVGLTVDNNSFVPPDDLLDEDEGREMSYCARRVNERNHDDFILTQGRETSEQWEAQVHRSTVDSKNMYDEMEYIDNEAHRDHMFNQFDPNQLAYVDEEDIYR